MNDLIYSVRYIFKNYLQKQHCSFFNIPQIQRGYKWTADNVMQLLDHLKNFGNKRKWRRVLLFAEHNCSKGNAEG